MTRFGQQTLEFFGLSRGRAWQDAPPRPTVSRLLALGLCMLLLAAVAACNPPYRVVYVVRHADKAAGEGAVPLSETGEERARALAALLAGVDIRAIYSTSTRRTVATAQPLADALGLEVQRYDEVSGIVATLRREHAGEAVLVVGHSNTVPQIIQGLGAALPAGLPQPIVDSDYDNLVVVLIDGKGAAGALHTTYGMPTPP